MTQPKPKRQRDAKGRLLPGNLVALTHGARHFMIAGKLPSMRGRRALNKYLKSLEKDLIETTGEMNVKKEILVKQVIRAEGVMRLIEMWLQKGGIMKPQELMKGRLDLQGCLSTSYIAFMNTERLALLALGLEAKPKGEPTLADIIRESDEEEAKEERKAGQGAGDPGLSEDSGDVEPGGGQGEDFGEGPGR